MSLIETFINRVDHAHKTGSKELRLQIKEAKDLCNELAVLAVKNGELASQVIELQQKLLDNKDTQQDRIVIDLDGGTF